MNVLMTFAKENRTIREVWIETVYIDDNASQRDKRPGGSRRDGAGRGKPERHSTESDTETNSMQRKVKGCRCMNRRLS